MNAGIGLLTCVRLNDGKHFLFASKGVVRHLLRFAKPRFSGEVAIGNSHSCSSRHSRMRIRRASKASRPRNFAKAVFARNRTYSTFATFPAQTRYSLVCSE